MVSKDLNKIDYYCYELFPPLDWEICFLSVTEYKTKLIAKYQSNPVSHQHFVGPLADLLAQIDAGLSTVVAKFNQIFPDNNQLRCEPMILPLPTDNGQAQFAFILKREEDGDTMVYSPVPLSYLDN